MSPPLVATAKLTKPSGNGGATQTSLASETTSAGTLTSPNTHSIAAEPTDAKPSPCTVISFPPPIVPARGVRETTVTLEAKVKVSSVAEDAGELLARTAKVTVPAACGGAEHINVFALNTNAGLDTSPK